MAKTITIRLPLIVTPSGEWNASGWGGVSDSELVSCAWDGINSDGGRLYWITAEVEVPTTETITGTVEEADND